MSELLAPVDLVLVWHHHQPDYRSPVDGRAVLPWAWLHASKDYLDMARQVERHPGARVTFNLVPSLLDQIEAAAAGAPDVLVDLLARPIASLSPDERRHVMWRCGQGPGHAAARWPAYRMLRDRAARGSERGAPSDGNDASLSDRELLAFEIWFLLAWVDPMFLDEPEAARAIAEQKTWSEAHRDALIALHRRLAGQVIPAYRALAAGGRIEISSSPYHHPILPLLMGLDSARRAMPRVTLPAARFSAPEDARLHVERALERHASLLGARPSGMWPSEGSVSPEAAALAARCGVRWLASDEAVLTASLDPGERRPGAHYQPWRFETDGGEVTLFFRDHDLSDRIGFVYQRWDADEAVADFVARLREIGRAHAGARPPVVSVILDGENCWEGYRDDGGQFLTALYGTLASAAGIRMRTPSDVLADGAPVSRLARLHSGSWIDADFHIWIGHPEKNRAWDLVAGARSALIEAGATPDTSPRAWQALYRAEGSDWFWWFGDDHHTADLAVFDRLFRDLVRAAYTEAGLAPPGSLRLPVARGAAALGGTAPIGFIHPTLDGRPTTFYEWHEAGRAMSSAGTATHRAPTLVRQLLYGFDADRLYLRLDLAARVAPGGDVDLGVEILEPRPVHVRVHGLTAGERPVSRISEEGGESEVPGAACRVGEVIEIGLPFSSLGLAPRDAVALVAVALRDGRPFESYPTEEGITFVVPDEDFEASMWSV